MLYSHARLLCISMRLEWRTAAFLLKPPEPCKAFLSRRGYYVRHNTKFHNRVPACEQPSLHDCVPDCVLTWEGQPPGAPSDPGVPCMLSCHLPKGPQPDTISAVSTVADQHVHWLSSKELSCCSSLCAQADRLSRSASRWLAGTGCLILSSRPAMLQRQSNNCVERRWPP